MSKPHVTTRKDMALFVPRMLSRKRTYKMLLSVIPLMLLILALFGVVLGMFVVVAALMVAVGFLILLAPFALIIAFIVGPNRVRGWFSGSMDVLMSVIDWMMMNIVDRGTTRIMDSADAMGDWVMS